MAKISNYIFKSFIESLKEEDIRLSRNKKYKIKQEMKKSLKSNTTLSFKDRLRNLKVFLSLLFVVFFISISLSYSQNTTRIIINSNSTTATVPVSLLNECYAAVVERDSALYREGIRKENNNILKYKLLECNIKIAKLKKKNNLLLGGVGIIVIINVLKLLL